MIKKVVIPAAGLGTRLLPVTKELPKEMLPVFVKGSDGSLLLKPMMQQIFEELYDVGFREFCFIVGRGKRAIEDHFTQDYNFISSFKTKNNMLVYDLEKFYEKLGDSIIVFTNQPRPKGFGDAVLRAESFVGDEPFLVHAGDDLILSKDNVYLKRLIQIFSEFDSDGVLLVEEVDDPRKYGVVVGEEIDDRLYRVNRIVEKPETPPSNLAVVAIYIFSPKIFDSLKKIGVDERGELQLTNAIQRLVSKGCNILCFEFRRGGEKGRDRYTQFILECYENYI